MLVTAGGLNGEGQWIRARQDYLFPTGLLTSRFRDMLLERLAEALLRKRTMILPQGQSSHHWRHLFHTLAENNWHGHIQPPYGHPMGVIRYLAFYMRGGPISEDRLEYDGNGAVRVAYKRPDEHRSRFISFTQEEFLQRFLIHVPAPGVRVVRAYGLLHHRCKAKAEHARRAIEETSANEEERRPGERVESSGLAPPRSPGLRCPHCGARLLVRRLGHPSRAPPEEQAA
jgi:hypothetical protein